MKTVFVGAIDVSAVCLEAFIKAGADIKLVYALNPAKASRHADYCDISKVAGKYGIKSEYIDNVNSPIVQERLKELKTDILAVIGWSRLVSDEVLSIPKVTSIGMHPTMLPANRGRHPVIWALVLGLKETGVTFFHMAKRADNGDILWQKAVPIDLKDDAATLQGKIMKTASAGILEFYSEIEKGNILRIPQDESKASSWRKRSRADGEINWSLSSMQIYNLVRALTRPYPGAHTFFDKKQVTVWKASFCEKIPEEYSGEKAGDVIGENNGEFLVKTGDGALWLTDYDGSLSVGGKFHKEVIE